MMQPGTHIGTLTEQSLHAGLKRWLAKPGDAFEQRVDGYQIDIVRGSLLIEIQTANFSALKTKLGRLLENHKVVLVHPIAQDKWIVRKNKRGKQLSRRKSPKHGRIENLFDELLYIPHLAAHPNFSCMAVFTQQEEIWQDDGAGSWRRKHWSIADRRLLEVTGSHRFRNLKDYLRLLPRELQSPFTHKQMAQAMGIPIWQSTRLSYCMRKMGALENVGKQGQALLLAPRSLS
ncbi:MAG: hypothetical protein KIT08_10780 [Anaerolineales bacterium]|nr:MAG: hypothetical protein KIT08_10780 [Anaerolineales bacterium]